MISFSLANFPRKPANTVGCRFVITVVPPGEDFDGVLNEVVVKPVRRLEAGYTFHVCGKEIDAAGSINAFQGDHPGQCFAFMLPGPCGEMPDKYRIATLSQLHLTRKTGPLPPKRNGPEDYHLLKVCIDAFSGELKGEGSRTVKDPELEEPIKSEAERVLRAAGLVGQSCLWRLVWPRKNMYNRITLDIMHLELEGLWTRMILAMLCRLPPTTRDQINQITASITSDFPGMRKLRKGIVTMRESTRFKRNLLFLTTFSAEEIHHFVMVSPFVLLGILDDDDYEVWMKHMDAFEAVKSEEFTVEETYKIQELQDIWREAFKEWSIDKFGKEITMKKPKPRKIPLDVNEMRQRKEKSAALCETAVSVTGGEEEPEENERHDDDDDEDDDGDDADVLQDMEETYLQHQDHEETESEEEEDDESSEEEFSDEDDLSHTAEDSEELPTDEPQSIPETTGRSEDELNQAAEEQLSDDVPASTSAKPDLKKVTMGPTLLKGGPILNFPNMFAANQWGRCLRDTGPYWVGDGCNNEGLIKVLNRNSQATNQHNTCRDVQVTEMYRLGHAIRRGEVFGNNHLRNHREDKTAYGKCKTSVRISNVDRKQVCAALAEIGVCVERPPQKWYKCRGIYFGGHRFKVDAENWAAQLDDEEDGQFFLFRGVFKLMVKKQVFSLGRIRVLEPQCLKDDLTRCRLFAHSSASHLIILDILKISRIVHCIRYPLNRKLWVWNKWWTRPIEPLPKRSDAPTQQSCESSHRMTGSSTFSIPCSGKSGSSISITRDEYESLLLDVRSLLPHSPTKQQQKIIATSQEDLDLFPPPWDLNHRDQVLLSRSYSALRQLHASLIASSAKSIPPTTVSVCTGVATPPPGRTSSLFNSTEVFLKEMCFLF